MWAFSDVILIPTEEPLAGGVPSVTASPTMPGVRSFDDPGDLLSPSVSGSPSPELPASPTPEPSSSVGVPVPGGTSAPEGWYDSVTGTLDALLAASVVLVLAVIVAAFALMRR